MTTEYHKEAFGNTVTNEKLPTNNGFITFNPQGKIKQKIIIKQIRFLKNILECNQMYKVTKSIPLLVKGLEF